MHAGEEYRRAPRRLAVSQAAPSPPGVEETVPQPQDLTPASLSQLGTRSPLLTGSNSMVMLVRFFLEAPHHRLLTVSTLLSCSWPLASWVSSNLLLFCRWGIQPLHFSRWKSKYTNPNPGLLPDIHFHLWREWKTPRERLAKSSTASLESPMSQMESPSDYWFFGAWASFFWAGKPPSPKSRQKYHRQFLQFPRKRPAILEKKKKKRKHSSTTQGLFSPPAAFSPQTLVQGWVVLPGVLEPAQASAPWQYFLVSSIEGVDSYFLCGII